MYDPDRGSLESDADVPFSREATELLCCDDAARLFHVALSLLSRQFDVLDVLDGAAGTAGLHHDCAQRRRVLMDLFVSLWAAVIAANTR